MNFDIPTPPSEKEPRYPSFEEVKIKVEKIVGKENLEVVRIEKDETGKVSLYEVSTTDEKGDATIFTYRRGGDKAAATDITATYYVGSLENGIPTSAENLSTYNSSTGQWTDVLKNEDIEYKATTMIASDDIARQETMSPEFESPLAALSAYIKANKPAAAGHKATEQHLQYVAEIQSSREQDPANLYKLFDEAEASFGSVEIKDVLYREEHDMPAALEAREKLNPLLRVLQSELIRLNKSEKWLNMLIPWNPKGSLTKEQFDELDLRRKKLANAYGSLKQDPISFKVLGIDHNRFKL